MLLFATFALGCASTQPRGPVVVERIYYVPAPVSPPDPWPPAAHRHRKPKRHPPRVVVGAHAPAKHGHGHAAPPAARGPRKKLPPGHARGDRPRRSFHAEVPKGC